MNAPLPRTAFKRKATRKCVICRTEFESRGMGHKACGPACAVEVAVLARVKKEAHAKKLERKADRAKKESFKTRNQLIAEVQTVFNLMVRLEDADKPCISCGTTNPKQRGITGGVWDAGHYLSRGASCHLRFDRRNVHKQCKGCNRPGGCSRAQFRAGVEARIGKEALEALEADQTEGKWTKDELRAMKAHYQAKVRELRKERHE